MYCISVCAVPMYACAAVSLPHMFGIASHDRIFDTYRQGSPSGGIGINTPEETDLIITGGIITGGTRTG